MTRAARLVLVLACVVPGVSAAQEPDSQPATEPATEPAPAPDPVPESLPTPVIPLPPTPPATAPVPDDLPLPSSAPVTTSGAAQPGSSLPWTLPSTLLLLGVSSVGAVTALLALASWASWLAFPFLCYAAVVARVIVASMTFLGPVAGVLANVVFSLIVMAPFLSSCVFSPVAAAAALAAWFPLPFVEHAGWVSTMAKDARRKGDWRAWLVAAAVAPVLPALTLAGAVLAHAAMMTTTCGIWSFFLSGDSFMTTSQKWEYLQLWMAMACCGALPIAVIPLLALELPASGLTVLARDVAYVLVDRLAGKPPPVSLEDPGP